MNRLDSIISSFGINEKNQIGFFNYGGRNGCFLVNFNNNKKMTITKDTENYEIFDISSDGKLVITIDVTYDRKKRFLKVFDIKSKKLVFKTNEFFVYEALFSTDSNLIILRAEIKRREKTFIYDIKNKEIVYIFPRSAPLNYGDMNFEYNNYILPHAGKKNEFIVFSFDKLEARHLNLDAKKLIHRVLQIAKEDFFVIDGDYNAIRTTFNKVIWKTKLNYDEFNYAPSFFKYKEKIFFDITFIKNEKYLFSIELDNGDLSSIKVPTGLGSLKKYFDNLALDPNGITYNLDTNKTSDSGIISVIHTWQV